MKDSCLDEPEMRFPDFTDNWETIRIGDFIEFIPTNSLSRAKLNMEKGIVKNIHYGDIHTKFPTIVDCSVEEIPYINPNENISKFKDKQYCKNGDLIIADASEDYADIGKAIEVINVNVPLVSGLHTILARDKLHKTSIGFKGYLFLNENLRKKIKINANGISVLGISKKNIANLEVRLPSIQEQEKIVNFLRAVDKKIELLEKKKYFNQYFNNYCSKKIFSMDEESETVKLGNLVDYFNSTALEKYFNHEGGYKVISIGNYSIDGKYIDNNTFISKEYAELNKYLLKKNDLAMVLNDKTKQGNIIGRNILIDKDNTYIFNQRTARLVPKDNINAEFLHYLINSPLIHKKIFSIAQGGTQIYINKDDLLNIDLPIPNEIKQIKITAFFKSLNKKKELIDSEIKSIRNFKKGLLQKMFI